HAPETTPVGAGRRASGPRQPLFTCHFELVCHAVVVAIARPPLLPAALPRGPTPGAGPSGASHFAPPRRSRVDREAPGANATMLSMTSTAIAFEPERLERLAQL